MMTDYGTVLSGAQAVSRWTRMKARESFRRQRAAGVRRSRRCSSSERRLAESSLKIVFAAFVIPRDERAMTAKFDQ